MLVSVMLILSILIKVIIVTGKQTDGELVILIGASVVCIVTP